MSLCALSVVAGPLEEARDLHKAGKSDEAATLLEKAAAADPKDTAAPFLLFQIRAEQKKWDAMCEALVVAGKRGIAWGPKDDSSRQINETLGACNWYAKDEEKIAVFGRLAREFPEAYWRVGWLCICLSAHARLKHDADVAAVEKDIAAIQLDAMQTFRVGRAYVECDLKPERAVELIETALAARGALPLPEEAVARETVLTEMGTWRSYLAFAYELTGKRGPGNPFWEAEPADVAEFEDATEKSGLAEARGNRVAVGDFDGDGWDDLAFNGAVFRNNRGVFERLAVEKLPAANGAGSLWADADGDGDVDLWVFSNKPAVRLFLNDGAGAFVEANDTGLGGDLEAGPEGAGLADANGDGLPDLYLAVYESGDLGRGGVDKLFLSQGAGKWADALEGEEKAEPRAGRGVNWGDFDDDGDADCFVSNYRLQKNYLWRNDGKGGFANVAKELGVEGVGTPAEGNTWYGHTIGSCWADLDNDMDLDLVSANLAHPRFIAFSNKTQILMNQGASLGWKFCDVAPWCGLPYEETLSDPSAADFDNDGDLDLYFTSVYRERPSWLLRNDGAGHFEPVTWRAGVVAFNGWGQAWLDADNDGDLDLVVCANGKARLYLNGLDEAATWLSVSLKPKKGRTSIGARVSVFLGDSRQTREIAAGRGTTSQDSARQHFGFGKRAGTASVVVKWPGGKVQRVEGVEANRGVEIVEGE
ncbi:MAG: CRTAC1 family protein [Planctomycetota bacterium]